MSTLEERCQCEAEAAYGKLPETVLCLCCNHLLTVQELYMNPEPICDCCYAKGEGKDSALAEPKVEA